MDVKADVRGPLSGVEEGAAEPASQLVPLADPPARLWKEAPGHRLVLVLLGPQLDLRQRDLGVELDPQVLSPSRRACVQVWLRASSTAASGRSYV